MTEGDGAMIWESTGLEGMKEESTDSGDWLTLKCDGSVSTTDGQPPMVI